MKNNVINMFQHNLTKNKKTHNDCVLAGMRTAEQITRLNKAVTQLRELGTASESAPEKGLLIDVDYSHGQVFFVHTAGVLDIASLKNNITYMVENFPVDEYWGFLERLGYSLGVATWAGLLKNDTVGTEITFAWRAGSEDEEIQYDVI